MLGEDIYFVCFKEWLWILLDFYCFIFFFCKLLWGFFFYNQDVYFFMKQIKQSKTIKCEFLNYELELIPFLKAKFPSTGYFCLFCCCSASLLFSMPSSRTSPSSSYWPSFSWMQEHQKASLPNNSCSPPYRRLVNFGLLAFFFKKPTTYKHTDFLFFKVRHTLRLQLPGWF